jgi:glycopeptide antibiotics resistance protein
MAILSPLHLARAVAWALLAAILFIGYLYLITSLTFLNSTAFAEIKSSFEYPSANIS